ncbi:MAG TPA: hypothetical protein PLI68_05785 [Bacteroidia bacterium]|nr:hypothetical protein [Bacteroidia bacterium]
MRFLGYWVIGLLGYWLLVIGYWLLVIGLLGYWILGYWVIGFWVLGYWVLGYFIMGNEFEDYLLTDGTVGKLSKSIWLSDRMF